MRLFGKHVQGEVEEEKTVKLTMGGYQIQISGRSNRQTTLSTMDALFETELKEDSKLERCGRNIYRLKEPKGTFSQQVLELVDVFSHELYLFPVEFTDAFTRTLINSRSLVEIYDESWDSRPIGPYARFSVRFNGASEPINVVLEIQGELEIWDNHFAIWRAKFGTVVETKSRMIPTDEDYPEAVLNRKAEEIYARMKDVAPRGACADQEGILPAGIGLGDQAGGEFKITAQIYGREIIRWIVQAALDCGVLIAETALSEWDLKLP